MLESLARLDKTCKDCPRAEELVNIDDCDSDLSSCKANLEENLDYVLNNLFGDF